MMCLGLDVHERWTTVVASDPETGVYSWMIWSTSPIRRTVSRSAMTTLQ